MARQRRKPQPPLDRKEAWRNRLQTIIFAVSIALCVAAPLVTSERPELTGAFIPQTMLWLLIAGAWFGACGLLGGFAWRWQKVDYLAVALVAVCGVSTWANSSSGAPRAMLNGFWTWLGMGVSFIVLRQVVTTRKGAKAVCTAMLGVAVLLGVCGWYDTLVTQPQVRALYEENPEEALRQAGVVAPPGSVARLRFASRLNSSEPVATFSLTNSLAGFLVPWICFALGLGVFKLVTRCEQSDASYQAFYSWFAIGIIVVVAGGCLLLTKSRTAWLALIVGLPAIGFANVRTTGRLKVRLLGGLAVVSTLGLVAVLFISYRDPSILSAAGDSVTYRLEYWYSTWLMMVDHPWLGIGPGNFQEVYTAYKLPQASESIADPHSWLLEMLATFGVVGIGTWSLAVGISGWHSWRKVVSSVPRPVSMVGCVDSILPVEHSKSLTVVTCVGFFCGIVVAVPLGWLGGYAADLAPWLIGVPLALTTIGLLSQWGRAAELPVWLPLVALGVLLFNLLAAGGISFPGVAVNLWVLIAAVGANFPAMERKANAAKWPWFMAAAIIFGLFFGCQVTAYRPNLDRQRLEFATAEAVASGRPQQAIEFATKATNADPYSSAAQMQLAHLYHQQWQGLFASPASDEIRVAESFRRFEAAAEAALKLNPKSYVAYDTVAYLFLHAYLLTEDTAKLQRAVKLLKRSVALYPTNSLGHAQLAWTLSLAGDIRAAESAKRALQLDLQNDHFDRQLANRHLFEGAASSSRNAELPRELHNQTAEQIARQLRSKVDSPSRPSGKNSDAIGSDG